MRKFGLTVTLIAVSVTGIPLLVLSKIDFLLGFITGLLGAVAWVVLMRIGVRRYRKRFCWFFLTAPLGLFWPLVLVRWFYGASHGDPNWMAP
jgi:hypothetical protein